MSAFFDIVLDRLIDPDVPAGCLIVQSAAQLPTLTGESSTVVATLLARQRARCGRARQRESAGRTGGRARALRCRGEPVAGRDEPGRRVAEDLRSIARTACEAVARAAAGGAFNNVSPGT